MDKDHLDRIGWFGLKRPVKSILGFKPINIPLRALIKPFAASGRLRSLPVNIAQVRGTVPGGEFVLLDPMRCTIAKELYWGDSRRIKACERTALELFCGLARSADIVLDIGANTGIFSIASLAVNPNLEVHAFEIVPEVFELMYRNFGRNRILDRAFGHLYAVGDAAKKLTIPALDDAVSLPMSFSSRDGFGEGRTIASRTLDSLQPWFAPKSRVLVKVDVEGTENDVFRFGGAFTREFDPDFLCEILLKGPGEEVTKFLAEHRYDIYKITDEGLLGGQELEPDRRFHDWLFTKRPVKELAEVVSVR